MEQTFRTLMMKSIDNVAVTLQDVPPNSNVIVNFSNDFSLRITLKEQILFGHKFAVRPIKKGDEILKYGEIIGKATKDIEEGEHVHVHNLEGIRGRGDKVEK
ncbi:UxaA family hydrolase [Bacillus sp. mrc49]|uniref:UxaA family hydrolase n=1 Tax=Bacillus sp. mrc49 TaxID=2054913 RepID=UPI001E41AF2E|nr:UxaA family hydrolase [Bacillus sp. mrc49]